MKITIWGAGTLGYGLAFRLMTSNFTTELGWINRTYDKIQPLGIDFRHGLAFAPNCREVHCYREIHAKYAIENSDIVILCHGVGVKKGQTRKDVYKANASIFDQTIIKQIKNCSYNGIILVLTNHVDLMSRYLQNQTNLPHVRVIGLGTVVETARLRRALAETAGEYWNARQLWPFAIGTHDENFVPIFTNQLYGPGCYFDIERYPKTINQIINEVKLAAKRVKEARLQKTKGINEKTVGTMFPIIEGTYQVVRAIAEDRNEVLTISVYDSKTSFYYSLPSVIGRSGVINVYSDFVNKLPNVSESLKKSLAKLKETISEKE